MTWRLYALSSGGAVIVTAVAALIAPTARTQPVPAVTPQAVDRAGAAIDLGAQADRLKTKLAEATAYRAPSRDAFRFGVTPPRVAEPLAEIEQPAAFVPPSRPPYALAGMATTVEDGVPQRTAILSSLQGVSLVKEGSAIDGGYRVVSIADDAVTLESSDGTQTTLRLSTIP